MKPIDGAGNAEQPKQPTLLERISSVNVSDTNKLSQNLAGITADVDKEITKAFSEEGDGGKSVTNDEASNLDLLRTNLCNLKYRIKTAMQNAGDELKNLYEDMISRVSVSIKRATDASAGKNPDRVVAYEPSETDSAPVKKTPNKMYWKDGQEAIAKVYEEIVNPQGKRSGFYNRPQVKIGGLLGFVAQYADSLDKEQVFFIRKQINTLNAIAQQKKDDSFQLGYEQTLSNLPDIEKVIAYWNAIKSAGYSHDLVSELTVLGYSKEDAKKLAKQV